MLTTLLAVGVGVVGTALATPRSLQCLSQELLTPGKSLLCPGILLPQENALCTETCCSAVDQTCSGAATLGD